MTTSETPVTRGEFTESIERIERSIGTLSNRFSDEYEKLAGGIDQLKSAKQVTLPSVLAIIGLAGAAFGFAIKNFSDVASLAHKADDTAASVGDFRERLRSVETGIKALGIEQETQNKWMSDIGNEERERQDLLNSLFSQGVKFDLPPRGYFPLGRIGDAPVAANGNGHKK